MNNMEKQEISSLPQKYRPLSAWQYFFYSILFGIPFVGFVLLIIFSFNNDNVNRRSFARSYFCGLILALAFIGIILTTVGSSAIIAYIMSLVG